MIDLSRSCKIFLVWRLQDAYTFISKRKLTKSGTNCNTLPQKPKNSEKGKAPSCKLLKHHSLDVLIMRNELEVIGLDGDSTNINLTI